MNKFTNDLLPALPWGEDPEKSFLTIGVGLENRWLVEDFEFEPKTLDAGDPLLPSRPLEQTDLLLKPSGVDSLEYAFHEFLVGTWILKWSMSRINLELQLKRERSIQELNQSKRSNYCKNSKLMILKI